MLAHCTCADQVNVVGGSVGGPDNVFVVLVINIYQGPLSRSNCTRCVHLFIQGDPYQYFGGIL